MWQPRLNRIALLPFRTTTDALQDADRHLCEPDKIFFQKSLWKTHANMLVISLHTDCRLLTDKSGYFEWIFHKVVCFSVKFQSYPLRVTMKNISKCVTWCRHICQSYWLTNLMILCEERQQKKSKLRAYVWEILHILKIYCKKHYNSTFSLHTIMKQKSSCRWFSFL